MSYDRNLLKRFTKTVNFERWNPFENTNQLGRMVSSHTRPLNEERIE